MHQRLDTIKPTRRVRNFQRCVRDEPQCTDADEIGEVQPFEGCVVREIQENPIRADGRSVKPGYFREEGFLLAIFLGAFLVFAPFWRAMLSRYGRASSRRKACRSGVIPNTAATSSGVAPGPVSLTGCLMFFSVAFESIFEVPALAPRLCAMAGETILSIISPMRTKTFRLWALAVILASGACAADKIAPKIDKQKLEAYMRYAEGYAAQVSISIDDPTASSFKGYFRLLVHLSNGPHKVDRVYYVTADGQQFVNGNIWPLNENPFADTLEHMPTDGPSFGPETAKITMVIFSDFECPYCREFAKTMRDNIPQKYPDAIRVIFKDFPIASMHKWAEAAAEASHCVQNQKPEAFWTFHDWIFEHQQEVNEGNLREKILGFVKDQNLDAAKASSCMDTHATAEEINRSLEAGRQLQIQQTPTIFLNGRTIGGAVPWDTLNAVIQLELNRPKDIPGPTAAKCCEVTIPTVVSK